MFRNEYGREPLNERELAGHIAKLSRQQTTAVAGFDLTFSPVKSVSTLWALADPALAAAIERCHQQAVADALAFIEAHALFTRTGTDGVRQVDVRGLVGAAFTHRDSRAGDPDLHTHVAVANKVQTLTDGRWLSIDSRVLHKAVVTASETYNTALERHLAEAIGVRFAPRPDTDPRKRPIREIVGVDPALNQRWSTRRQSIEVRRRDLAATFQADHGRPPTPVEAIALAQQATLETRDAKHEPRSLAEQRTAWRTQAGEVLGGEVGIQTMIHAALHPVPGDRLVPTRAWLEDAAKRVVAVVQRDRSTWQTWHLRAEALRRVRAVEVPSAARRNRRQPARRPSPDLLRRAHPARSRRARRTRSVAAGGRGQRLHGRRVAAVHLERDPGRRSPPGRRGRTARRHGRADASARHRPAGGRRQRRPAEPRTGPAGPRDGHLRSPGPARDRAGRIRQDHRHERPFPGLDRGRRNRDRTRPVSRRGGRPR